MNVIGFFALFIESLLGSPQAYKNFVSKSAAGVSFGMIGGWVFGDSIKTAFFIYDGAPFQFLMCGVIQLFFDFIIVLQIIIYSRKSNIKTK